MVLRIPIPGRRVGEGFQPFGVERQRTGDGVGEIIGGFTVRVGVPAVKEEAVLRGCGGFGYGETVAYLDGSHINAALRVKAYCICDSFPFSIQDRVRFNCITFKIPLCCACGFPVPAVENEAFLCGVSRFGDLSIFGDRLAVNGRTALGIEGDCFRKIDRLICFLNPVRNPFQNRQIACGQLPDTAVKFRKGGFAHNFIFGQGDDRCVGDIRAIELHTFIIEAVIHGGSAV